MTTADQWDRNREGLRVVPRAVGQRARDVVRPVPPVLVDAKALPGRCSRRSASGTVARRAQIPWILPHGTVIRSFRQCDVSGGALCGTRAALPPAVGSSTDAAPKTPCSAAPGPPASTLPRRRSRPSRNTDRRSNPARLRAAGRASGGVRVDRGFRRPQLGTGRQPQQVIDKVGRYHQQLGHEVIHLSADTDGVTPAQKRRSLELFQSDVAPILRDAFRAGHWPRNV